MAIDILLTNFSLHFCILEVIKLWRWGRLGNDRSMVRPTRLSPSAGFLPPHAFFRFCIPQKVEARWLKNKLTERIFACTRILLYILTASMNVCVHVRNALAVSLDGRGHSVQFSTGVVQSEERSPVIPTLCKTNANITAALEICIYGLVIYFPLS